MKSQINRLLYKSREKIGLINYMKKQVFLVNYNITLNNVDEQNRRIQLLLPLPIENKNQRIVKKSSFNLQSNIYKEERFNNQYVVFKIELSSKTEFNLEQTFTVEITPRKSKLNNFVLSDYKNNSIVGDNYLQPNLDKIKVIAKKQIGHEKQVGNIISILNNYVINNLSYGNPIDGLYTSEQALEKEVVDCGGFNTLLASLCMSVGIPARIVSGFWAGYKNNDMHAWLELMLPDGSWIPADPSVEQFARNGRTKKSGKLGFVGSDRIAMSVGCDIPIKINEDIIKLDILQTPVVFPYSEKNNIQIQRKFITKKIDE